MKLIAIVIGLLTSLMSMSCRLYFWAGEHEFTIPPKPPEQAEPTPTPDLDLRA